MSSFHHSVINNNAIGLFDSGMGGLTVMREVMTHLPNENVIYFGDIARLPYGTKSVETIRKFTAQTVKFLLDQNVKAIVIACNTITSVAVDLVKELAGDIPVLDVISSGSKTCMSDQIRKIGVIATPATINSMAYPKAIHQFNPQAQIISQACALFVPMIEEGLPPDHPALELIARDYLQPLIAENIDSLVLGCTHYPLIKETIKKIMGNHVTIIDPAIQITEDLIGRLFSAKLFNEANQPGKYKYFVTDLPLKFKENGERFLHNTMDHIQLVNVADLE